MNLKKITKHFTKCDSARLRRIVQIIVLIAFYKMSKFQKITFHEITLFVGAMSLMESTYTILGVTLFLAAHLQESFDLAKLKDLRERYHVLKRKK